MNPLSHFVSLHPYFRVHPGKLDAFKALLPEFVAATSSESRNLFYDFTINGDEIFCREGYVGAEGILAHLANVDLILKRALEIADIIRLEVHGPREEIDKLREPLAGLNPVWFVYEQGIVR